MTTSSSLARIKILLPLSYVHNWRLGCRQNSERRYLHLYSPDRVGTSFYNKILRVASQDIYKIHLPQFEGPFDLLLFFIERDELDIYNIPITRITNEFLDFIHKSEALNI